MQNLSLNPLVLTHGKQSSLYALPFAVKTSRSCFSDASVNRPAILLFDSKKKAEIFKTNTLPNLALCSFTSKWSVPCSSFDDSDLDDVSSFKEVICKINYDKLNSRHITPVVEQHVRSEQLMNLDNDLLMTLTLCAFVVYFYVEHIYIRKNGLEITGILLNQREAFDEEHIDFRRNFIISNLNQTYYTEKNDFFH